MSAVSAESPQSASSRTGASDPGRAAAEHPDGAKDFGPNEWLVDELYQRYLADPGSVDMAWWNFFADYTPPAGSVTRPEQRRAPAGQAARRPRPRPGRPRRTRAGRAGHRRAGHRRAGHRRAGHRRPGTAGPGTAGPGTAGPGTAGPGTAGPGTAPPPSGSAPPPSGSAPAPSNSAPAAPAAAQPGQPASPPAEPAIPDAARLRGAAARTAVNMEASLAVPTATSVRTVPAKLLIDNRIVINNHLARGRGGKVSFTHLIGFAVIRALAAVPEMNSSYTELDGKPAIVEPSQVNLGLAIDVTAKDGSRQLLVPSVKAAEDDGLPPVLDGLRGCGPPGPHRQARRSGLRRHHDHADQPGHDRHRALGAPADGRAGLHRRRRAPWSTRPPTRARPRRPWPGWLSARRSR